MTNPTTPFSWQMPTATDLVTDLPADFEVFGQAVATSMADLLGGTTGQVLAKASNTNMDFSWVTTDDANAIQNSIVDAKGDLISATANDTPARLAVGANNTFLRANSAEATGLEYAGTYTAFTPTYNNITIGNGTNTGRYLRIGNFVHVTQQLTFGSTTSVTGAVTSNFPFTASSALGDLNLGGITFLDAGVKGYTGFAALASTVLFNLLVSDSSTTYLGNVNMAPTVPHTWGNGDKIFINYVYEAA
jgi:hypothetical protein